MTRHCRKIKANPPIQSNLRTDAFGAQLQGWTFETLFEDAVKIGVIFPAAAVGDFFAGQSGLQEQIYSHFEADANNIFMKRSTGFLTENAA